MTLLYHVPHTLSFSLSPFSASWLFENVLAVTLEPAKCDARNVEQKRGIRLHALKSKSRNKILIIEIDTVPTAY